VPVSWTIAAGAVILESDEGVTFDEWKTALDAAFAEPGAAPKTAIVHDLRRMARVPAAAEAAERAQLVLWRSGAFAIRKWAVVVTPGMQGRMTHMAEAFTRRGDVEFRAFTDLAEAKIWATREQD
jgi:SpoIIAA-like